MRNTTSEPSDSVGPSLAIASWCSNIPRMKQKQEPSIIVSPYYNIAEVLKQHDVSHVVSILGGTDRLEWPPVEDREVIRLQFDDIGYSSGLWTSPSRDHITKLVEFARGWNGRGTMAVHCRAGSSRSPAAAMIAVASLNRPDTEALVMRVATARSFFRPNATMLRLADELISPCPQLLNLVRSLPVPSRTDVWGPVRIPLRDPTSP